MNRNIKSLNVHLNLNPLLNGEYHNNIGVGMANDPMGYPIANHNIYVSYPVLAREFLNHFYSVFDNNYRDIGGLYDDQCRMTFMDYEFSNFGDWIYFIQNKQIHSFHHSNVAFDAQPIDQSTLLISVSGNIITNMDMFQYRFSEVFVLRRGAHDGQYYIINHTFRLFNN